MKKSYMLATLASFCLMACCPRANEATMAKQPQASINNAPVVLSPPKQIVINESTVGSAMATQMQPNSANVGQPIEQVKTVVINESTVEKSGKVLTSASPVVQVPQSSQSVTASPSVMPTLQVPQKVQSEVASTSVVPVASVKQTVQPSEQPKPIVVTETIVKPSVVPLATDQSMVRCRDGSSEKIGKDACLGKGGVGENHLHYHSD